MVRRTSVSRKAPTQLLVRNMHHVITTCAVVIAMVHASIGVSTNLRAHQTLIGLYGLWRVAPGNWESYLGPQNSPVVPWDVGCPQLMGSTGFQARMAALQSMVARDEARAIQLFGQARCQEPQQGPSSVHLALLLDARGFRSIRTNDWGQGLSDLVDSESLMPSLGASHRIPMQAYCLALLQDNQLEFALVACEQSNHINQNFDSAMLLGRVLFGLSRTRDAEQAFLLAQSRSPFRSDSYYWIAAVKVQLNDKLAAAQYCDQALAIDPDFAGPVDCAQLTTH